MDIPNNPIINFQYRAVLIMSHDLNITLINKAQRKLSFVYEFVMVVKVIKPPSCISNSKTITFEMFSPLFIFHRLEDLTLSTKTSEANYILFKCS